MQRFICYFLNNTYFCDEVKEFDNTTHALYTRVYKKDQCMNPLNVKRGEENADIRNHCFANSAGTHFGRKKFATQSAAELSEYRG